ncbi:SWIM zinc finger family protein [Streptomyces daliensis]
MTGQGVRWTAEQVAALAPDEASRRAGDKLSAPGPWSEAGAGAGAVWGLCKGSGSKPYRTVVDLNGGGGPGYKCSCPSRKFPCKHALGLLLLWAGEPPGGGGTVAESPEPPEWAGEWLSGRRERAVQRSSGDAGAIGGGTGGDREGSGRSARPGTGSEGARKRAEQRAQRIAAGATELEQRLADLLRGGLAGADQAGYAAWDEMAARMVDAQAPGLASRIRELGTVPSSGRGWPERLLSECALLHLLDQGFLGLEVLPEPLAATVRARVGLTVDTAELLADEASRIRDHWLVLAQRDGEEGRLTVRRIWLWGRDSGRPALLLSFGAGGRAPELALPVGASVEADLAFYPGASPLRAALGERHGVPEAGWVPPGGTVEDALAAYGAALCEDPWLDGWPAVLRDVVPVPPAEQDAGSDWQVADAEQDAALPVTSGTDSTALWKLLAISGGGPLTVFGECGHRGFAPYATWNGTDMVPL